MYNIKLIPTEQGFLNPALSGIVFSFMEQPVRFQVETDDGKKFLVKLTIIKNDPKQPRWHYEAKFTDAATYEITFANPSIPGTSGTSAPYGTIMDDEGHLLGFACWVDTLEGTDCVRISYAFYDDTVRVNPKKGDAQ